ncbi:MAG: beta-lactamase family protein [Bacteroidetes bacterium]|nr:beta-lactamase family protein [Bacteroidota bacterium]
MRKTVLPFLFIMCACTPKHQKTVDPVDRLFLSEFRKEEPGAAVLIMHGNKILFEKGYGLADIVSGEKIAPTTLFNIGSISKTFVANTVLLLATEGRLSVDDRLDQYFNFKNPSISKKVKLHHLLTHTSGLPDNRRKFLDSVYLLTAKDQENWNPIELNDSLLFEPGSRFEYSNPAFNGLALIIEKVTGRKWQEVVSEKIFKPSNMPTSKITDGAYPQQGVSHGYVRSQGKFIEKDYGEEPTFAAAGNGGVWSSVRELAHYELALRNALFLKKDVIEHSRSIMRYTPWLDSLPPYIGYSWFISQTDDHTKIVSHTGTQGGFHADFVSIPEQGFLYVVLSNRSFPREEFRKKILAMVGLKERAMPVPK